MRHFKLDITITEYDIEHDSKIVQVWEREHDTQAIDWNVDGFIDRMIEYIEEPYDGPYDES